MASQSFWKLVKESRTEKSFVHTQNKEYSLSVKSPRSLIPFIPASISPLLSSDACYSVIIFHNGKPIESHRLKECALDDVLGAKGREYCR